MPLLIAHDTREEAVVVRVEGEIDSSNVDQFTGELSTAVGSAARHLAQLLVVDLDAVGFLGSAGLRALLDCRDKGAADGAAVRLVATGAAVRRPIEVTNLDGVLTLYPNVAAALEPPETP